MAESSSIQPHPFARRIFPLLALLVIVLAPGAAPCSPAEAAPRLLAPNGGQRLLAGEVFTILWESPPGRRGTSST